MSQYKYVYPISDYPNQLKGNTYVQLHFMIGYNQGYVQDYQEMAAEMKKDFPDIDVNLVHCSHVTKSSYCEGFTLVRWCGSIKLAAKDKRRLEKAGWTIVKPDSRCEYCWR